MTLPQASGETLRIIKQKIKEDEFVRDESLEHIKDWLKKSPHLPDEFDEKRLLIFLRSCKYSLEKCKRKLDMYFTVRTILPQYFINRDVMQPEIQEMTRDTKVLILPSITKDGYRLGMMKGPDENAQPIEIVNLVKVLFMTADARLAEECVAGDIYLIDFSQTKATHFMKLTPTLLKHTVIIGLQAYPLRIKAIHVINIAPWIVKMYNLAKLFLPTKMQNRVYFHNNINQLHDHIPKELLPNDYGGDIGTVHDLHDKWIQRIADCSSWFKEQENIKSNEALRLNSSVDYQEVFGIQGSFRQLAID